MPSHTLECSKAPHVNPPPPRPPPPSPSPQFFLATVGARRRMERKWQETPLAAVFSVEDEWVALKQRAQAAFVREALRTRYSPPPPPPPLTHTPCLSFLPLPLRACVRGRVGVRLSH